MSDPIYCDECGLLMEWDYDEGWCCPLHGPWDELGNGIECLECERPHSAHFQGRWKCDDTKAGIYYCDRCGESFLWDLPTRKVKSKLPLIGGGDGQS